MKNFPESLQVFSATEKRIKQFENNRKSFFIERIFFNRFGKKKKEEEKKEGKCREEK